MKAQKFPHPLTHNSKKAKLVRAIRDRAYGKTFEKYIQSLPEMILVEMDLPFDKRCFDVFSSVEMEIFGRSCDKTQWGWGPTREEK